MILKEKKGLCQLAGIDRAEIAYVFLMLKLPHYGQEMNMGEAFAAILGEINSKYPKSKRDLFIKRIYWILPYIVKGTPISGAPIFYSDANKSRKIGNKKKKKQLKVLMIQLKIQNCVPFLRRY